MSVSSTVGGLGIAATGIVYYALGRAISDSTYRRWAESRWKTDRHFSRALRRGEVSKEEWTADTAIQLRKRARGWQPWFSLVWLGCGIYIIVAG